MEPKLTLPEIVNSSDIDAVLGSIEELVEKARRDKQKLEADIALLEREKKSLESGTNIVIYTEEEKNNRISRIEEALSNKRAALGLVNALLHETEASFGVEEEPTVVDRGSQPDYSSQEIRRQGK